MGGQQISKRFRLLWLRPPSSKGPKTWCPKVSPGPGSDGGICSVIGRFGRSWRRVGWELGPQPFPVRILRPPSVRVVKAGPSSSGYPADLPANSGPGCPANRWSRPRTASTGPSALWIFQWRTAACPPYECPQTVRRVRRALEGAAVAIAASARWWPDFDRPRGAGMRPRCAAAGLSAPGASPDRGPHQSERGRQAARCHS